MPDWMIAAWPELALLGVAYGLLIVGAWTRGRTAAVCLGGMWAALSVLFWMLVVR